MLMTVTRVVIATLAHEFICVPLISIELFMSFGLPWQQSLEVLMQLVDSHRANPLILPCSHVDLAGCGLLLASDENEVPLLQLVLANLLVQGVIRGAQLHLVPESVQVQVDAAAVIDEFDRDWHDCTLPWRDKERPFACSVLDQDSHEAFDGA